MFHQAIQYVKFLLKSTNEHGVHSPFVYNLVTKCFYDKTTFYASETSTKKEKLLHRLKKYFEFRNSLQTAGFEDEIQNLTSNSYDFIFFNENHQKEITLNYFESLLHTVHNDSVFVFDAIYSSAEMVKVWETIKQHPQVTVTIDTFYLGFVFFRKEQVKEHFIIRV